MLFGLPHDSKPPVEDRLSNGSWPPMASKWCSIARKKGGLGGLLARLDCMWGQQRRSLAVDCNIAEKGINSTDRTEDMLVGTLLSDPSGCTTTPIRLGNEFNGKSTLRMTSIASVQLLCPFCCQFRFPCPACLQSRITNRIFAFVENPFEFWPFNMNYLFGALFCIGIDIRIYIRPCLSCVLEKDLGWVGDHGTFSAINGLILLIKNIIWLISVILRFLNGIIRSLNELTRPTNVWGPAGAQGALPPSHPATPSH